MTDYFDMKIFHRAHDPLRFLNPIEAYPWAPGLLYCHLQTSCLNKSLVLKWFYGLEQEKIIENDFCPHREYQVSVSHKVKSFE